MESEINRTTADAVHGKADKIARDVTGMVNEASEVIKEYGSKKYETARQSLSQAQTYVTDGYHQAADVTDQYVHENPWRAVGIAAAAGVLIGLLIRR
jgi:ElaB/YqjD/DUF883 family membrane-anchored ribosome-binding protein